MLQATSPFLTMSSRNLSCRQVKTMACLADNNFKSDERVKKTNTIGKGEIACYEQFLLFPQCFQKTCTAHTKK